MIVSFFIKNKQYQADLTQPLEISIPLKMNTTEGVNAWYCPPPEAAPQQFGTQKISVKDGAAVNSFGIKVYPHGNGTHTECVGHITAAQESVSRVFRQSHWLARLTTCYPTRTENGDRVIQKQHIEEDLSAGEVEALIIRTMPNDDWKLKTQYSGSNPPYISAEAMAYIVSCGIKHLLIDTPSVDKEDDGGKLQAHRLFWQGERARDCTITELIYVPDTIADGIYLVDIHIPPFELDAAPSRVFLFKIT